MKTELPKSTDCYWKIVDTILTCTRRTHIVNTLNLLISFNKMFPNDKARQQCLARIFNHKAKEYRVKQIQLI